MRGWGAAEEARKAEEMLPGTVILLFPCGEGEGCPLLCHTTQQLESRLERKGVDVKF